MEKKEINFVKEWNNKLQRERNITLEWFLQISLPIFWCLYSYRYLLLDYVLAVTATSIKNQKIIKKGQNNRKTNRKSRKMFD